MRKRVLSAGLSTLLIAMLVAIFSAPASASPTWERDLAKVGSVPSVKTCVIKTGAHGCWHANGDVWWVEDSARNGYAAEARWYEYIPNLQGDLVLHRNGACVNGHGKGTWGACNKDYQENGVLIWRACNVDSGGGLHGCSSGAGCHTAAGGACSYQGVWPPPPILYRQAAGRPGANTSSSARITMTGAGSPTRSWTDTASSGGSR